MNPQLYPQLKLVFNLKVPNVKVLQHSARLNRLEQLWEEWKKYPTEELTKDILNVFQLMEDEYVSYKETYNELHVLVSGINVLIAKFSVLGIYKYKEDIHEMPYVSLDKKCKFNPYENVEYKLLNSIVPTKGDVLVLSRDGLIPGDKHIYFSHCVNEDKYCFSEGVNGVQVIQ